MSSSTPRLERNASDLPSALHFGDDSLSFENVSWRFSLPSQLASQMWRWFLSSSNDGWRTVYAIQLPSGESRGEPTSRKPAKSAGGSWGKEGRAKARISRMRFMGALYRQSPQHDDGDADQESDAHRQRDAGQRSDQKVFAQIAILEFVRADQAFRSEERRVG